MKTFKITKKQGDFLIKLIKKHTKVELATGSECAYIYKAVNGIITVTEKKVLALKEKYHFLIGVELPVAVEKTDEDEEDTTEMITTKTEVAA